jgi:putative endonuclease
MNKALIYYVYILECADGKYYTGSTTSLEERVNEHQIGLDPFSFTYCRRPVKLVWCESYDSLMEAAIAPQSFGPWSELQLRRIRNPLIGIGTKRGWYNLYEHSASIYNNAENDWYSQDCYDCYVWYVIHEIGHGIDYAGTRDADDYGKAIGADVYPSLFINSGYNAPRGHAGLSSKKGLREDFAESFTFVVFDINNRYIGSDVQNKGAHIPDQYRINHIMALITSYTQ